MRPSQVPTSAPTIRPSQEPTSAPTIRPSQEPTSAPTIRSSQAPTSSPTRRPSQAPTAATTVRPSQVPTSATTMRPSQAPKATPTIHPSQAPTPFITKSAPTTHPSPTPIGSTLPTNFPSIRSNNQPYFTNQPSSVTSPAPSVLSAIPTYNSLNKSFFNFTALQVRELKESLPSTSISLIGSIFPSNSRLQVATIMRTIALRDIYVLYMDQITSPTIQASRWEKALDNIQRSIECCYYASGFNTTIAVEIIAIGSLSSILAEGDAEAFHNYSSASSYLPSIWPESLWEYSCTVLMSSLLPQQSNQLTSEESLAEDDDKTPSLFPEISMPIQVYFINGILNDENKSLQSTLAVKTLFDALPISGKFRISALLNPSSGFFSDLYQTYQLVVSEKEFATIKYATILQLYSYLNEYSNLDEISKFTGVDVSKFRNLFNAFLDALNLVIPVIANQESIITPEKAQLVENFATTVKNSICTNQAVIIVAHSQGNLLMNLLYEKLLLQDPQLVNYVTLVPIATPASYVAGTDSSYVTRTDDLIIGAIASSLPENTAPMSSCVLGSLGHELSSCYLSDPYIFLSIFNMIYTKLQLLRYPRDACGRIVDVANYVNSSFHAF